MIAFRVSFPEHIPADHREAYLNELFHLAEWRRLEGTTHLVATPASRITDLRESLVSERRLHRLRYQEVAANSIAWQRKSRDARLAQVNYALSHGARGEFGHEARRGKG